MTDAETSAAIEALAYRLRERDAAMRDGSEYADAEVFATEFMLALRTKGGWRPTPAKAASAVKLPAGTGTGPTEEWRRIRAERAAIEAQRAAQDPGDAA